MRARYIQIEILMCLLDCNLHTISEIRNETGYSVSTIRRHIQDLSIYRLKLNKGEKTQYYVENSNVAIISREIFDRAQELLKLRKNEEHKVQPKGKAYRRTTLPLQRTRKNVYNHPYKCGILRSVRSSALNMVLT